MVEDSILAGRLPRPQNRRSDHDATVPAYLAGKRGRVLGIALGPVMTIQCVGEKAHRTSGIVTPEDPCGNLEHDRVGVCRRHAIALVGYLRRKHDRVKWLLLTKCAIKRLGLHLVSQAKRLRELVHL